VLRANRRGLHNFKSLRAQPNKRIAKDLFFFSLSLPLSSLFTLFLSLSPPLSLFSLLFSCSSLLSPLFFFLSGYNVLVSLSFARLSVNVRLVLGVFGCQCFPCSSFALVAGTGRIGRMMCDACAPCSSCPCDNPRVWPLSAPSFTMILLT